MISAISLSRVNLFLLRKQHLSDDAQDDNIFQITDDISGLHATGAKEPYLALFARTKNFLREQLDDELYVKRRLGKIRCMRGTLYILTKAMIPVVYAATGPMVERLSRRYSEFRGLSAEEYREISGPTLELLKGKGMTIARIRARLGTKSHLSSALNLMCDQGLLVRIQPRNGWKHGRYHYAIFEEYVDDIDLTAFNESDGTTQLVRRYLRSFGPTTETDIAWWTRLNKGRIREALDNLSGETTRLSIPELTGDFIILRSELSAITNTQPTDENIVNLLPTLDPYLMGYKRRDRYLPIEHYNRVFDRSGNATSTILVNGRVAGVWDYLDDNNPEIRLHLFDEVGDEVWQVILSKAKRLGHFMSGSDVVARTVVTMATLVARTAGAFMSPLKDSQG